MSQRAECHTLGASLRLASHFLLTVAAAFYNWLWGPFPMFLMEIAQSEDADSLLRELDILKDEVLEAADTAIRATDPALADLCDALRWTAADGDIGAITALKGVWTLWGLLLTAIVTLAAGRSDTKVIKYIPLSLVQGGPLLEYVSN